jgi:hypothetical protein
MTERRKPLPENTETTHSADSNFKNQVPRQPTMSKFNEEIRAIDVEYRNYRNMEIAKWLGLYLLLFGSLFYSFLIWNQTRRLARSLEEFRALNSETGADLNKAIVTVDSSLQGMKSDFTRADTKLEGLLKGIENRLSGESDLSKETSQLIKEIKSSIQNLSVSMSQAGNSDSSKIKTEPYQTQIAEIVQQTEKLFEAVDQKFENQQQQLGRQLQDIIKTLMTQLDSIKNQIDKLPQNISREAEELGPELHFLFMLGLDDSDKKAWLDINDGLLTRFREENAKLSKARVNIWIYEGQQWKLMNLDSTNDLTWGITGSPLTRWLEIFKDRSRKGGPVNGGIPERSLNTWVCMITDDRFTESLTGLNRDKLSVEISGFCRDNPELRTRTRFMVTVLQSDPASSQASNWNFQRGSDFFPDFVIAETRPQDFSGWRDVGRNLFKRIPGVDASFLDQSPLP